MQAVVAAGLLVGPAGPLGVRLDQRLAPLGHHDVQHGGGAAGQRRPRARVEVVTADGAGHRLLEVGLRVHTACRGGRAAVRDRDAVRASQDMGGGFCSNMSCTGYTFSHIYTLYLLLDLDVGSPKS